MGGKAPNVEPLKELFFNLFIRVTAHEDNPRSDKLTIALKDLAEMLAETLGAHP